MLTRLCLALYFVLAYIPGTYERSLRRMLWTGPKAITSSIVSALVVNDRLRPIDLDAYRVFGSRH